MTTHNSANSLDTISKDVFYTRTTIRALSEMKTHTGMIYSTLPTMVPWVHSVSSALEDLTLVVANMAIRLSHMGLQIEELLPLDWQWTYLRDFFFLLFDVEEPVNSEQHYKQACGLLVCSLHIWRWPWHFTYSFPSSIWKTDMEVWGSRSIQMQAMGSGLTCGRFWLQRCRWRR